MASMQLVAVRKPKRKRAGGGRAPKRRVVGGGLPAALKGYARIGGFYGRYSNGGELKFFDTNKATQASATAGVIHNLSLNLVPQGVTESTRVGRKCTIRKMFIKGEMTLPPTATSGEADNTVRLIVYCDKQANGATAAVVDILETASPFSFRNLANSQRFQILYDNRWAMTAGAVFGGTGAPVSVTKRISFNISKNMNLPIEFSDTTGAIGEIRSNNIGVLSVCEAALVLPTVRYTSRIRFSDS